MEEWKNIKEFEEYEISNYGKVRKVRNHNKILKAKISRKNKRKDERITLYKNKKPQTLLISRLVACTFYNKNLYDKKYTVRHKDGNSLNNNIKNLELITLRDNIKKAFELGIYNKNMKQIKITIKDKKNVYICKSMAQASRVLKKNNGYISAMIKKNIFENEYAKWEMI